MRRKAQRRGFSKHQPTRFADDKKTKKPDESEAENWDKTGKQSDDN